MFCYYIHKYTLFVCRLITGMVFRPIIILCYSKTTYKPESDEKEASLQKTQRNITCNKFVTYEPTEAKTRKESVTTKRKEKIFMKQTLQNTQDLLVSDQGRSITAHESIPESAESDWSHYTSNNTKRTNRPIKDNDKKFEPIKDDLLSSIKMLKSPKVGCHKITANVSAKSGRVDNKVNANGETPLQIACRQVSI